MRQEQPARTEPVVTGKTTKVPGLQLKQRVRAGSLSPRDAMQILMEANPTGYSQTETFKWLSRRLS